MKGRSLVVFVFFLVYFLIGFVAADVVLKGRNFSLRFPDVEMNFGGIGACGVLYVAEPLDACAQLTNKVANDSSSPFALIRRGGCSFDEKVQNAQTAGFKASIVYDNKDDYDCLDSMVETPASNEILSVFVSKVSGDKLKKYARDTDMVCCILPSAEISTWSTMAISIIALVSIFAILAACRFIRGHWTRRRQFIDPSIPVFSGMSQQRVKTMPISIFTSASDDNSTSTTCAICLDDYNVGEKLRVLPCRHEFHAVCVDSWLTAWRSFCPICKLDAKTRTKSPPASENTPLLPASVSSPSSSGLSSFCPLIRGLFPIQIGLPPRPPSSSHAANSYQSFNNPFSSTIVTSSTNLRHASSESSRLPYLVHPHSIIFLISSRLI